MRALLIFTGKSSGRRSLSCFAGSHGGSSRTLRSRGPNLASQTMITLETSLRPHGNAREDPAGSASSPALKAGHCMACFVCIERDAFDWAGRLKAGLAALSLTLCNARLRTCCPILHATGPGVPLALSTSDSESDAESESLGKPESDFTIHHLRSQRSLYGKRANESIFRGNFASHQIGGGGQPRRRTATSPRKVSCNRQYCASTKPSSSANHGKEELLCCGQGQGRGHLPHMARVRGPGQRCALNVQGFQHPGRGDCLHAVERTPL